MFGARLKKEMQGQLHLSGHPYPHSNSSCSFPHAPAKLSAQYHFSHPSIAKSKAQPQVLPCCDAYSLTILPKHCPDSALAFAIYRFLLSVLCCLALTGHLVVMGSNCRSIIVGTRSSVLRRLFLREPLAGHWTVCA